MITIPGRIPLRIHPIFWIFAALISSLTSTSIFQFASWMIVIFVSVIVHEMGHALTAICFGQRARIDLIGFGGLTQRTGRQLAPWQDFVTVLNGPLAGLSLAFSSYLLLSLPVGFNAEARYLLSLFTYANIFWTALNLIPVLPLDGYHLFRIIMEKLFGLIGTKISLFISLGVAICASIFSFAYNHVIPGIIFMLLTYENYTAWKGSLEITAADRNEDLRSLLKNAQINSRLGNDKEALLIVEKIRRESEGGVLHREATLFSAEILSKQGDYAKAFEQLQPLRAKLPPQGLTLLQQAAYQNKNWKEAASTGVVAYQAAPSSKTAILNAMCHAQMREVGPAVGWIKCALQEDVPHLQAILQSPDFDNIRQDPLFKALAQEN